MRVSFDLDGTAWRYRPIFAALAKALQAAGHEVGVITAHDPALFTEDKRLWKARGFPEPHFFYNLGDIRDAGIEWLEPRTSKLAFARLKQIDVHIDDFDSSAIELVVLMPEAGA